MSRTPSMSELRSRRLRLPSGLSSLAYIASLIPTGGGHTLGVATLMRWERQESIEPFKKQAVLRAIKAAERTARRRKTCRNSE